MLQTFSYDLKEQNALNFLHIPQNHSRVKSYLRQNQTVCQVRKQHLSKATESLHHCRLGEAEVFPGVGDA